jgi:predicted P-loop ATPase
MLLRAAVRRARQPGAKFDYIIVLESPEGKNKSTAVALLAGHEYFSDQSILAASDKEQQELVRGRWFYEIAELGGMRRAEVQRVKAFASRDTDRARPAYGRCVVNAPRRCVFVGTTNDSQYLMSQTGNRRFLPVKVGTIDLGAIVRDRDQLFAEAAVRDAQGESIMLPESLWAAARDEQSEREAHDPWDDALASVRGERFTDADGKECERLLSTNLLENVLAIPRASQTQAHSARLAGAMRRLGWEGPKQEKVDGKNLRGYRRPLRSEP